MNAVVLLVLVTAVFIAAYRLYARKIENLWQIDPKRATPAISKYDGIDYVPAKHWLVLFGHHFSSIAGAGPVIGPVIACTIWGWAPAMLWVILGSIFLGGIHDLSALVISMREGGMSIADIAEKTLSRKFKIIFSIFLWLALILVVAVFAYLAAQTFVTEPKIILPSLGLIPVAIFTGIALYHYRWHIVPVTIGGIVLLLGLLIAGTYLPIEVAGNGQAFWMIVLLIYCFFASILPVNILLQPRDYLSSYLLVAGMVLGILGIFISHPTINTPAFMAVKNPSDFLWPMMFITIACGAVSGFHSLVSSGTTSKQIANEAHARRIGFGGMIMEGFLAALVIVIITSGFSSTEFQIHILKKTAPINIYGLGFGNLTKSFLGPWGTFIALTVLNAFILTTLDTATRIARYIGQELFGIKNRFLSTFIIVVVAGYLALGKDSANTPVWQKIWPAFGASNQLVAALTLLVVTSWLLAHKKPTIYSLLPAIFMLLTSVSALGIQIVQYARNRDYLLIIISGTLITLALYLAKDVFILFRKIRRRS